MKKTILIFVAILTISLTSCNKDEPTPAPSKTDLLTQSEWTAKKAEYFENGELVDTDVEDEVIKVKYNTDLTGKTTYEDGEISTWTWTLADSESKIVKVEDGETYTSTIEELSSSKLTLSEEFTFGDTVYRDISYLER